MSARNIRQRVEYLHSLVEASKAINSTLDLDELLRIILRIAVEKTRAEAGTIYLVDHDKGEVWSRISDRDREIEIRLKLGEGIAGWVAQTGEIVNVSDAHQHPRFTGYFDRITGFETHSMLCMPMRNEDGHIIGVFQIMNKHDGAFGHEDEEFLSGLSVHATLAIRQAALHKESLERRALEYEMTVAREIQQNLLPKHLPSIDSYDFAATNVPAKIIGGDYYDFIGSSSDSLQFCIADVCGKGVSAALIMATLRTVIHFHELSAGTRDLRSMMAHINRVIYDSTPASKFISLFYAKLAPETGRISFVNAGHNPPLLIDADGKVSALSTGGMALGLVPQARYELGEQTLPPGSMLVLYTDGLSEAMNSARQEYGEERLVEFSKAHRRLAAHDLLDGMIRDVRSHLGETPQNDDITLMIIKKQEHGNGR